MADAERRRVLVVDDDEDVRRVVRRGLEREQVEVLDAADGPTALARMSEATVDLVVLDRQLPGMSGLELLAELRRQHPSVHVIMLTGAASESDRVQGLSSGADDYVAKPFSARELAARVSAALRRRPVASARPVEDWPAESSQEPTLVLRTGEIVYANRPAVDFLAAAHASDLVGRSMFDFLAERSAVAARARYERAQQGQWPRPETMTVRTLDGREVFVQVATMPVSWAGVQASQVTLWDLTDDRERLRELATGVRTDVPDAVLIIDTAGRIQSVNAAAEQLYGWHEDELLGQEWMESMPWLAAPDEVAAAQAALIESGRWHGELKQRHRDGRPLRVRCSGTALRDSTGQRAGTVFVNREAPEGSHEPGGVGDGSELDADLRRGIIAGEFFVAYQPIIRLHDSAVVGAEALVRWQHPKRGVLPPAEFIDAAERSGAIVDLGAAVVEQATAQCARWLRAGHDLHIAVNLSGRQLADPQLPERLLASMGTHELPPGALWLEVTETSLVGDFEQARETLDRIAAVGARVAIDDFGTGWASLTYLRELPVHALKVDRSFVDGLGTSSVDAAIVSSIISLAGELDLDVIAEGIETESQRDCLRELSCGLGQGFFFGRPAAAEHLDVGARG